MMKIEIDGSGSRSDAPGAVRCRFPISIVNCSLACPFLGTGPDRSANSSNSSKRARPIAYEPRARQNQDSGTQSSLRRSSGDPLRYTTHDIRRPQSPNFWMCVLRCTMNSLMGNSTIGNSPYQWGISVVGFFMYSASIWWYTMTYYAYSRLGRYINTLIARITG